MSFVVTLEDFTPIARFDSFPWTHARIQEAPTILGPWTTLETKTLSPVDSNPATPATRDFTTSLATLGDGVGWYRVVWVDAANATSTSDAVGPSDYPTTEELVGESSVTELTGLTELQQDSLRVMAIAAVEDYCGQSFSYETSATKKVNGTGLKVLYLPTRVEAITAISIPNSALEIGDVLIGEKNDKLYVDEDNFADDTFYTRTLRELDGNQPMLFPFGDSNISITGDWGWADFPDNVRIAIRKDMEDTALADSIALNPTIRAYRKLGIQDISQGDLRASIGIAPGISEEVMSLLRPFVWEGRVGEMV
jgi:hypothetical protein